MPQSRRSWKSTTKAQHLFFLSLCLNEKVKAVITLQYNTSLVRQSRIQCKVARLTNNEYKMDSRPQIIYLFERHTGKYVHKS